MNILQHMISAQMAAIEGRPVRRMVIEDEKPEIMNTLVFRRAFAVAPSGGTWYGDRIRVFEQNRTFYAIGPAGNQILLQKSDLDDLMARKPDFSMIYNIPTDKTEILYFDDPTDHVYTEETLYGPFLHTVDWRGSGVFVYAYVWEHAGVNGITYILSSTGLDVVANAPRNVIDAATAAIQNAPVWRIYIIAPLDA